MTSDSKPSRGPVAPQIIAIGMLLWALNPANPYGYYIFLRIVVCAVCAYLALHAAEIENTPWVWVLGVTAVIYNPIVRIHLTREIWTVVNIATCIMLILTFRVLRKSKPKGENNA